ncbi:MAG: NAD(P)-dependent dehydrogenase (short-subunit alcohol dehydrogenase family) [Acidimicrobiales bacterium]|jgi:NAD(P)-dependent dehydrogenase (short-subunit alcohol dehydrogenase family)
MGRLDGKVAVITGGASGIGEATVRRFVAEGAKVLIADMQEERGQQVAAELGDAAAFQATNVSKETDIQDAIADAVDRWGRLDVMFNNAGFGGALGPISSIDESEYDMTMDVLLKGVFFGIKHAAPIMSEQGSGSIINTASICGIQSGYGPHIYSVAKAAVIALTETTSLELAEHDVRVNAVCPGFTVTPLAVGKAGADDDRLDKMRDSAAESQPIKRVGEADDLANMVLFLASDESTWVTGQAHVVDGGLMAGKPWRRQPRMFREPNPIKIYRQPDDA